jgi:hypothetical protein
VRERERQRQRERERERERERDREKERETGKMNTINILTPPRHHCLPPVAFVAAGVAAGVAQSIYFAPISFSSAWLWFVRGLASFRRGV